MKGVQIRSAFLIPARGSDRTSPLANLVRRRDSRALDLYLLVRLVATGPPFTAALPSRVWARALGLQTTAAETQISRLWRRLEDLSLVQREGRLGRSTLVRVLRDDGSGQVYSRPDGRDRDHYLSVPLAYFLDSWCFRLNLAEKAMLLIALNAAPGSEIPTEKAPFWFGMSSDTAAAGLRGLKRHGLLSRHLATRPEPLSPRGWVTAYRNSLLPPFDRGVRAINESTGVVDQSAQPRLSAPWVGTAGR
jgi:hypothetical protein